MSRHQPASIPDRKERRANVDAGTLTLHIGDPIEHSTFVSDRLRFIERVFMAAAYCNDTDSIAQGARDGESPQSAETDFYSALEELMGQTRDELALAREMIVSQENDRLRARGKR